MLYLHCLICNLLCNLLCLFDVCGGGIPDFSIGATEPMRITAADFRAYENAWSINFEAPDVDSILVFALCKEPCSNAGTRYSLLACSQLVAVLQHPHWYNAYFAAHAAEGESTCDSIRTAPNAVQQGAGTILTDATGGKLVCVRPPHTVVIFNEQTVIDNWISEARDELSVSLRATQIEVIGEHFGVRQFVHTVRLMHATQRGDFLYGRLTFALQNGCTAIGLSAPEFGNVRSVTLSGRLRCVWDCREDMIKEPYNSAPPTLAQLNTTHPDYAALPVKYSCARLPTQWMATILGFTVAVEQATDDMGYAQALLDAIDTLAAAVRADLQQSGLEGRIIFGIKNSPTHISFADLTSRLQEAQCVVANIPKTECLASSVNNPNYIYRRRLHRRLHTVPQTQVVVVEGLFISSSVNLFAPQNLQMLQTSIGNAIVENAPVLKYENNSLPLLDLEDIDFARVVYFALPTPSTTPPPAATSQDMLSRTLCAVILVVILCIWRWYVAH